MAGLTGLNLGSIAVGQHITARGIYNLVSGVVTVDATGNSSTNTGSVRIQSTPLFGTLLSAASGSLSMGLQDIGIYPVSVYNFAGNGVTAAQNSNPANYIVNTGSIVPPDGTAAGTPLYIDGYTSAFGAAPPDFNAVDVTAEASEPAIMQVDWSGTGAAAPFASLTDTAATIDLSNAAYSAGTLRIGANSIDLKTLAASPTIVPALASSPVAGASSVFLPEFAYGNATNIQVYNSFATFVAQAPAALATTAALRLVSSGTYDRSTNTFTATSLHILN